MIKTPKGFEQIDFDDENRYTSEVAGPEVTVQVMAATMGDMRERLRVQDALLKEMAAALAYYQSVAREPEHSIAGKALTNYREFKK